MLAPAALAYVALLSFPQVVFAHETTHGNFRVYSREPLDPSIPAILDGVEAKLAASGIADETLEPRIFLVDSHRLYSLLSLYVGRGSFAKCYPALPTSNVFVNASDVARDLVFRDAPENRERSLSGVLAHEVAHLLVRQKFGYLRNLTLPAWKQEGFAEYVAGGTLLDRDTGVRMWKQSPDDATGYRYFKYYMLVSHLLDIEKLSVDDLFTRDFDLPSLEREVLSGL